MSATQILATTAHAKMDWPPSPVIATLVTPAACAKPTSTSVSASHVRTEAPARTERTHTSVHAPKALRVRKPNGLKLIMSFPKKTCSFFSYLFFFFYAF